ncbi:flagellar biosynthetic protein FliO [Defluviitalea saccharophila]|uniref:Flagellar biosynthetic protein FliO n=1 Tax=Defluviitalea saccharophila TaxID=879970 RepID=A0ABZ2Y4G0_9FIRM
MNVQLDSSFSFLLFPNSIASNSGGQANINWFNMLGQFFFLIFLFASILYGAYYVTKWIGRFQYQRYQGGNIKVLESVGIGYQKMLQLIQVGDRIYLIGISKDNIVYLTEVEKEAIQNLKENIKDSPHIKFDSYLKHWIKKLGKDSESTDISSGGEKQDENK